MTIPFETGVMGQGAYGAPVPVLARSANLADVASASAALANLGGIGLAAALPKSGGTLTGALAPAVSALTFGVSVPVNAAAGNAFGLTLTASTATLANPSGAVDGQVIRFRVTQGGSGSYTLAFGSAYDFGAAGAPTLSTSVGKVDILAFEYVASISKWCLQWAALGN